MSLLPLGANTAEICNRKCNAYVTVRLYRQLPSPSTCTCYVMLWQYLLFSMNWCLNTFSLVSKGMSVCFRDYYIIVNHLMKRGIDLNDYNGNTHSQGWQQWRFSHPFLWITPRPNYKTFEGIQSQSNSCYLSPKNQALLFSCPYRTQKMSLIPPLQAPSYSIWSCCCLLRFCKKITSGFFIEIPHTNCTLS